MKRNLIFFLIAEFFVFFPPNDETVRLNIYGSSEALCKMTAVPACVLCVMWHQTVWKVNRLFSPQRTVKGLIELCEIREFLNVVPFQQ